MSPFDTPETKAKTRANAVTDRLRDDILQLHFAPGQRLGMAELAERYDVGFSPLREALSRLAGEGLVEVEGQRGFRAATMSRDDYAELHTLRAMVEDTGVRMAIAKGDDRWEATLVAAFHLLELRALAMHRNPSAEGLDLYEAAHRAFHFTLVDGAGMRRLSSLQQRLYAESRRYRHDFHRRLVVGPSPWTGVILEHRNILDAVLARDPDKAAHALTSHIAMLSDLDHDETA